VYLDAQNAESEFNALAVDIKNNYLTTKGDIICMSIVKEQKGSNGEKVLDIHKEISIFSSQPKFYITLGLENGKYMYVSYYLDDYVKYYNDEEYKGIGLKLKFVEDSEDMHEYSDFYCASYMFDELLECYKNYTNEDVSHISLYRIHNRGNISCGDGGLLRTMKII
jgi:hypothetical protein